MMRNLAEKPYIVVAKKMFPVGKGNVVNPILSHPQNHHKWIQMGCINHPQMVGLLGLLAYRLTHSC